jgi:hypothetical protein
VTPNSEVEWTGQSVQNRQGESLIMKYILNSTKTKWSVEPEDGDRENLVENITVEHIQGENTDKTQTKTTYETIFEREKVNAYDTVQCNLKLDTKVGNVHLSMPTSRACKKDPVDDTITQERDYVEGGVDFKKI